MLLGRKVLKRHKNDTPEYSHQSLLLKERHRVASFTSSSFKIKWKSISEQLFSYRVMSYIIFYEWKIQKSVKKNSRQDIYFSRRYFRTEKVYLSQS